MADEKKAQAASTVYTLTDAGRDLIVKQSPAHYSQLLKFLCGRPVSDTGHAELKRLLGVARTVAQSMKDTDPRRPEQEELAEQHESIANTLEIMIATAIEKGWLVIAADKSTDPSPAAASSGSKKRKRNDEEKTLIPATLVVRTESSCAGVAVYLIPNSKIVGELRESLDIAVTCWMEHGGGEQCQLCEAEPVCDFLGQYESRDWKIPESYHIVQMIEVREFTG